MKDTNTYLRELIEYLEYAITFNAEGRENFMRDRMTQLATERVYEVIGEIIKRLPSDFRDAHPEINWKLLINFRDFVTHNYDVIGLDRVWNAIEDAPRLKSSIEKLLRDLEASDASPDSSKS